MPQGEADAPGAARGKSFIQREQLPPVPTQRGRVPLIPTARTGNKSTQWVTPDRQYGVRSQPTEEAPQIPSDIFSQMRDAVLELASAQEQKTEASVREERAKKALEDLLAEHPEVNFIQILASNIEGGGPFAKTATVTDPRRYEDEVPHAIRLLSRRTVRDTYELPFGLTSDEGHEVTTAEAHVARITMLRSLGFTSEEIELLRAQGLIKTETSIRPPKQFVDQAERGEVPGSQEYLEIRTGRRRIWAHPVNQWEERKEDEE